MGDNKFVSNTANYLHTQSIDGICQFEWRKGIKHDCSAVMELERSNEHYLNNLKENVIIEDGLVGNYVQSILVDSDNTIYFGTYGSGLTYFKDGEYNHFTKKNGLTDDKIQTIVEGEDGTIYIGTYEGGLNILMNYQMSYIQ